MMIQLRQTSLLLQTMLIVLMSGSVKTQTDTPPTTSLELDPCYNYSVVNDSWRSILGYSWNYRNDTEVSWNGWYRLFLNGKSAQLPESCVNYIRCGGYTPLYLSGSHPRPEDGVVTREVLGSAISNCGYYNSTPIQVKACPGDYYVYQLEKPYNTLPNPVYCTVAYTKPTVDPCTNYTVLDQPWRSINTSYTSMPKCDRNIEFVGWYRLFNNGTSAHMPEYCVDWQKCGTTIPMWLNGTHPQVEDGVVVRQVCGSWGISDCCKYRSPPIQVKACPGNYYVYEFVQPPPCDYAYCSDTSSINPTTAPSATGMNNPGGVLGVKLKVLSFGDLTEAIANGTFVMQLQEALARTGVRNISKIRLRHTEKITP